MKQCVVCDKAFNAVRTATACSPDCKRKRRRSWEREYEKKTREKRRALERARYHADPEKVRARKRAAYRSNPERGRESTRRWRAKNVEQAREAERSYRNRNREKVRAKWRRRYRRKADRIKARELARYYANPQRRIETNRAWASQNPDRMRSYRRNTRARRSLAVGKHTAKDIAAILKAQHHRCGYCRTKLSKGNTHIDHITALSRGGTNDRRNLQALCGDCNQRKFNKDPIDFAQSLGKLL